MMMKYHQLYFTSDQISNCHFHPNPAGGDKASKKTALPGLGNRAEYPQEDGCGPSFLFVVCGVVVFFVRLSIRTSASTRFVICAVAFVVLTDFQEKEEFGPMCKVVIECASHHQGPSQAFAPFWHIYLGPEQLLSFYFPLSSAIFSVAASGSQRSLLATLGNFMGFIPRPSSNREKGTLLGFVLSTGLVSSVVVAHVNNAYLCYVMHIFKICIHLQIYMHMFMHHFLKVTPVIEICDIAFLIFSYNIHCTCVVLKLAYFIGIA